jgi:SAM-dependent methyltransferase
VTGSLNFDRIAERYDSTRGGEERGEQFAPDIAELLSVDTPVLEVGVGTGVIAKALGAHGFRTFGIDISSQMLVRARERLGTRVVQGDALALPFASACIDQVIGVWVLHVVGDATAALREVARILRPGGICLVVDGKAIDDHDDPVHLAFSDIERALGMEPRLGRAHLYATLAPDAALTVEDIVTAGPHPHETSIAEAAHHIESKAHSWMWDIDDARWARVSAPIVERLRSIPDFERPIMRDGYQEILVLRR